MPNSEYLGPSNGSTAGNGPLQLIGNNGVQPNLGEPTPSQSWMGDMGDSFFGTAAYTPAAQFGGNTQTNAYAQGLANQGLGMAGKDQILGANAAGSLNNVGNQYGVASQGAFGNASQALAAQNNALAMYQQAAQGNGPSAAQAQLQSGLDQSIQAQQAQAASARGGFGLANAQHQAAQNQAQLAGQAANNAAQLRAQEQQAAMAGYGNLGSTIQSQQAGNALAQQGNQLQAYGMGAGQQLAYNQLGQGNQLQYQNLANQALQAQTSADVSHESTMDQAAAGNAQRSQTATGGITSMVGSLIGSIGAMSDATSKSEITPDSPATGQGPFAAFANGVMSGATHGMMGSTQGISGQSSGGGGMLSGLLGGHGGGMGGMGGGGATLADGHGFGAGAMDAVSDERAKTGIAPQSTATDRVMSTLEPYTYKYKSPADEPRTQPDGGKYLGVIAQNLEKTPEGAQAVEQDPATGKRMINPKAGMSLALAGLGRLHERVSALEAMFGR